MKDEATSAQNDRGRNFLAVTDALYRSLLEQFPAVVYVDSNELVSESPYVSPQCEAMLGIPPEEFVADRHLWASRVHPDDLDRVHADWVAAYERQDRFESEYRWIKPDGTVIWVREASVLVRNEGGEPLFWQGLLTDITESKRGEEALRVSEARYRLLVENIPAVVYMVAPDDDRRTLYVNPQVERTLGYTRQEWLQQPDIWMELLHPDDREPTLDANDRHNLTGNPWSREYRLIASDGRALWFRDVGTLVRDEHGAPLHWLGIQLDITELKLVEDELRAARDELEQRVAERTAALEETNEMMSLEIAERRRAEEDLRATEQRYRILAENIPAVTYIWQREIASDDVPRGGYTSPRIEQMLGYTIEEWHRPQDFWMSRLHPDDRTAVLAATIRSESTGEPFAMEYRYLHKDGHIVWVLDEAVLLSRDSDGRPEFFQGVMLDVTARKEAEAKASQSELRFRALAEQAPAITYVADLGEGAPGRVTYVSPQVMSVLGYTQEEWERDWFAMVHPDDRDGVTDGVARILETGEPYTLEYRYIHRDGSTIWVRDYGTVISLDALGRPFEIQGLIVDTTDIHDEHGKPMFRHGVALDVTSQRNAEASLRELEERYRLLAGRVLGLEKQE
jgi:PAS domain S-box-containing protein